MNLQSQLGSLSIPMNDEHAQGLKKQIQDHCHIVVWEQKKMKRNLEKVREEQSKYLPKRLRDEQDTEMLKRSIQLQQRMSII